MKKNIYKLLALTIGLGFFFQSCDKIEQPSIDMETSQDNARTESAIGDVFGAIVSGTGTGTKLVSDCPSYLFEGNVLTITYADGCIGDNGLERSGTIIATFTNLANFDWAANTSATITFNNYFIDGKQLSGTMLATCNALEPSPVFTLSSQNMALTFEDAKTISWGFETELKMLEGWTTRADRSDDAWQINGTTEGIARNGKQFLRETTNLITSNDCKYFISGIIDLTIGESDTYKIEFKEPCGSIAITYKGITIQQTLQ